MYIPDKLGDFQLIYKINNIGDISVTLPKGYQSKFADYIRKQHNNKIAYLSMTTGKPFQGFGNILFDRNKFKKIQKNTCLIFIHAFYVFSNMSDSQATEYEKNALKGMGKALIYLSFKHQLESGKIGKDIKYVMLEADGGKCNLTNDVLNISETDALVRLYKEYPYDLIHILKQNINYDDEFPLQKILCNIEANSLLIKYYELFGFKRLYTKGGTGVPLYAPIDIFIKNLGLEYTPGINSSCRNYDNDNDSNNESDTSNNESDTSNNDSDISSNESDNDTKSNN